jgi:hypothetical protein
MLATTRILAAAVAVTLSLPAQALAAPSKEFRVLSGRAKTAASARDYDLAGRLHEQAYGALSDDDRVGDAGRDAVLESVGAREQAFHRDTAKRESLVAAASFLERHIADLQRLRPGQPTDDAERRLAAVRHLLGVNADPTAVTSTTASEPAGPWFVVISGQRVGPMDRTQLAEAYLVGDVTDDMLIAGPADRESVPLASSTIFASLNQWYLGRGEKWLGPMTRDAVLATVDRGRREGHAVTNLEVRLAWSKKIVAVTAAAPLQAITGVAAPVVSTSHGGELPRDGSMGDRGAVPPSGIGLLVSGTTLMGLGTITFLAGVGLAAAKPFTAYDTYDGSEEKVGYAPKVWGPPLGVGLAALVVAVPLVVIGANRNKQYRAYQQRVSAGAGPTAKGFGATVSVRF